ncbi:uncharacterized protein LOC119913461 isoform X2 [Micropterus salmoides]|uniref:uncharacterized protein LOC119913461 isoform X2 n=1 Tax=Micropterus salmoides TaxID=27706 RepID=UPI0018ED2D76|nr:uncharacterized protein LOC119913461 isoform X2 [Micropterus salmoides]
MTESGTSEDARRPSTAAVACSKVILSILPVTQITIGALYQNDCPKQHYIPIYLEVMGGYKLLLIWLPFLRLNHLSSNTSFRGLTIAFLLCWFITELQTI